LLRLEHRHHRQPSADSHFQRDGVVTWALVGCEPLDLSLAEAANHSTLHLALGITHGHRVAHALGLPARIAGQRCRHPGIRWQAPPDHHGRDIMIEQAAGEEEAPQWWPAAASSGRLRPLGASADLRSSFSRSSPASLALSQRATSTGWVLDARNSHHPSGVLTRTPSISMSLAPAFFSRALTSSTILNLRSSGQSKRSSGVFTSWGSLSRIAARLSFELAT